MTMIKEKNKFKEIEGAEFGVDSRYTSKKSNLMMAKHLWRLDFKE
jgi:hypothetical protein